MGAAVIYSYFFIPKASKSGLQMPPALCTQLTPTALLSCCRGVAGFGGKCSFLQPFSEEGQLSWSPLFARGCSQPGSLAGAQSTGSRQPFLGGVEGSERSTPMGWGWAGALCCARSGATTTL